jgi:hypothetical protein
VIPALVIGLNNSNCAVRLNTWITADRRNGEECLEKIVSPLSFGSIDGTGRVKLKPERAAERLGLPFMEAL